MGKKFRKLAAAFLAVLMLVGALPVSASADGDKLIALTFDDGPSSSNTTRLLDGLKARGAHCTFFLVGQMAEPQPRPCQTRLAGGSRDSEPHL